MNYDGPRELRDEHGDPKGLWHYTRYNDNQKGTWAIGYCSRFVECPGGCDPLGQVAKKDPLGNVTGREACDDCGGKGVIERPDPCPGHATPEDACEHYKQYLLDKRLRLDGATLGDNTMRRCEFKGGCEEFTNKVATCDGWHLWVLCDPHRTREAVSDLLGAVGKSYHS